MGLRYAPWDTFTKPVLDLLFGILNVDSSHRFTIKDIKCSEWFQRPQPYCAPNGLCSNPKEVAERMKSQMNLSGDIFLDDSPAFAYSQPNDMRMDYNSPDTMMDAHSRGVISFSQPVRTENGTQNMATEDKIIQNVYFLLFYNLISLESKWNIYRYISIRENYTVL